MVSEVKGASIKFKSYEDSVAGILNILKISRELKKYDKIVLKPFLSERVEVSTPREFVEEVLRFVLSNKNPVAEVFIAEGADGFDTQELFEMQGYDKLAEKYDVSLIDLNEAETRTIENFDFLRFQGIDYPKILSESFVISLPKLGLHEETGISASLSNMLGAFPAGKYRGFFSRTKNKIRKWPIKYSIYDVVKCKMPDFAVIDAKDQGLILAGLPLDLDRQAAKILGKESKDVPYLRLIDEESLKKVEKKDSIFIQ